MLGVCYFHFRRNKHKFNTVDTELAQKNTNTLKQVGGAGTYISQNVFALEFIVQGPATAANIFTPDVQITLKAIKVDLINCATRRYCLM